jgi:hypothetical protein
VANRLSGQLGERVRTVGVASMPPVPPVAELERCRFSTDWRRPNPWRRSLFTACNSDRGRRLNGRIDTAIPSALYADVPTESSGLLDHRCGKATPRFADVDDSPISVAARARRRTAGGPCGKFDDDAPFRGQPWEVQTLTSVTFTPDQVPPA